MLWLTSGVTIWNHVCMLVAQIWTHVMISMFIYMIHQNVLWNNQRNLMHLMAILYLHYKSSAVAEMGDSWPQKTWAENWGAVPLFGGAAGPLLTQCRLHRALLLYQVASWSIQPFGHNRHGPKIEGGCAPFRGIWVPSNTISSGPRPTTVPSSILMHPAIWPQSLQSPSSIPPITNLFWLALASVYTLSLLSHHL